MMKLILKIFLLKLFLFLFILVNNVDGDKTIVARNSVFPYSEQRNIFTDRLMLFIVDHFECIEKAKKDIIEKFNNDTKLQSIGLYRRIRIELRKRDDVKFIKEVSKMRPLSGFFPVVVGEVIDNSINYCIYKYVDISMWSGFSYGKKLPQELIKDLDTELLEKNTISVLLFKGIWYIYEGKGYYSPIRIGENMQHIGIFSYSGITSSLHYVFVREEYREKSIIDNLGSHRKKRFEIDENKMEMFREEFIFRRSLISLINKEKDERMDMDARQIVILRDKIEKDLKMEVARNSGKSSLVSQESCSNCNDIFKCPNCDLDIFPSESDIEFNSLAILQSRGFWYEDTVDISNTKFQINSPFYDKMNLEKYNFYCIGNFFLTSDQVGKDVGSKRMISSSVKDLSPIFDSDVVGDDHNYKNDLSYGLTSLNNPEISQSNYSSHSNSTFLSNPLSLDTANSQDLSQAKLSLGSRNSPEFTGFRDSYSFSRLNSQTSSSTSILESSKSLSNSLEVSNPDSKSGSKPLKRLPRPLGGSHLASTDKSSRHLSPSQTATSSQVPYPVPALSQTAASSQSPHPVPALSQALAFSPAPAPVPVPVPAPTPNPVTYPITTPYPPPYPTTSPYSAPFAYPTPAPYPYPYPYPYPLAPFTYPPPFPALAQAPASAPAQILSQIDYSRSNTVNRTTLETNSNERDRKRSKLKHLSSSSKIIHSKKQGFFPSYRESTILMPSKQEKKRPRSKSKSRNNKEEIQVRKAKRRLNSSNSKHSSLEKRNKKRKRSEVEYIQYGSNSKPRSRSEVVKVNPEKHDRDLEIQVPTIRIKFMIEEEKMMQDLIEMKQKENFDLIYPSFSFKQIQELTELESFWTNKKHSIINLRNNTHTNFSIV
ncbi:uncharacterized protein ELE39_000555 [Cryptosporidium sp. chipmunk genotype I]|uniref:uncharacterized protein n=1 Tax=Cryptosporidium sp. chipmunk genotype I TaxID=1280935 RepID=UPI00351AAF12|nr:hypothetical protein ELE39_000555 [Cryptosporidium sp. chipmunk genotype I]